MFQNKLVKPLVGIFSLLILSSCGAEGPGGGVAEFKTVSVSASAATTSLESDVKTGNTCTGSVSNGAGSFVTDRVDVTVTSTLYPGLAASAGLLVAIDGYTVQFIPDNSHSTEPPPAIVNPPSGTNLGFIVNPGATITIPVDVGSQAMKIKLVNDAIIPECSGKIHAYFAIITMNAVEIGTGTRKNIGPISLNIAFADRI
jgi:archaellum component FlaF (FlaF/FlaG flagellin family)